MSDPAISVRGHTDLAITLPTGETLTNRVENGRVTSVEIVTGLRGPEGTLPEIPDLTALYILASN